MNLDLLQPNIQQFIQEHVKDDVTKLLLKYKEIDGIPFREISSQIEAKSKCVKKLPTWYDTPNIYYPKKINIEQTSSEETARYKASLINGDTLIDLTGGFGIDCYYFSKQFKKVTHCEISQELSTIVSHNYKTLNINTVETIVGDGIVHLTESKQLFDWIYVDPSRRNDAKGKVFLLEDCLPDIIAHQNVLFEHTDHIMIKTSPLLDITNGIRSLKHVKEIHVVAVQNEVKELLWILDKNYNDQDVQIKTVNLKKEQKEVFNFSLSEEKTTESNYGLPKKYIFEPNSAILKAGGFSSISNMLSIEKLHQHSHLYTSDELLMFPGRSFEVLKIISYSKKIFKKELNLKKANITTRNFPESVATIRKKLNIKDGSTDYLLFTTLKNDQKVIIYCKKTH